MARVLVEILRMEICEVEYYADGLSGMDALESGVLEYLLKMKKLSAASIA